MRTYVFDMDGVLFRMEEPLPGAAETLKRLRDRGDQVFFLTNNSSKTRGDYVDKLTRLGMPCVISEVMTSAYATCRLLKDWDAIGKTVYVVGEQGLKNELTSAGMRVVEYTEGSPVDFVVVGWDRGFTYRKMSEAHAAIVNGARFVATNRDSTYPDVGGRTLPGGGAIVASIATSTGVEPFTVGKPKTYALEAILREAGATPDNCTVVGDRLDTDIAVGKNLGTTTALVLTGVSTREDVESAPADLRPDFMLTSLLELS